MQQVAINHRVITEEAERLRTAGYTGDAHGYIEQLLVRAISLGYRRIDPPPALRPTNAATAAQRAAHIEAAKAEVEAARRKRQETK